MDGRPEFSGVQPKFCPSRANLPFYGSPLLSSGGGIIGYAQATAETERPGLYPSQFLTGPAVSSGHMLCQTISDTHGNRRFLPWPRGYSPLPPCCGTTPRPNRPQVYKVLCIFACALRSHSFYVHFSLVHLQLHFLTLSHFHLSL
jgi:hypothetical protein